jgi:hypothetical protein
MGDTRQRLQEDKESIFHSYFSCGGVPHVSPFLRDMGSSRELNLIQDE